MTKPPYSLPAMADVARARGSAGLSVVSTFSGCGGSCLGFEMAGYRVLWSSEFIEAARETYAANHPETILDGRDIRNVKPAEILKATKLKRGELDVLQGSPPCASFSVSGSREKDWGKVKQYSDTKQRVDDLFFEFVRILEGLQPRAFVAENVAGLTIGTALGYFKQIMRALTDAGYRVHCRILDAQWLGVPQTRRRAIFVGVRKDISTFAGPLFPKPLPYQYALRDVIELRDYRRGAPLPELGEASIVGYAIEKEWRRLRPGQASSKYINLIRSSPEKPAPCITATGATVGAAGATHPFEPRKFTIDELRRICSFPSDFVLTGTYSQQWERLGRAVPPVMMRAVARVLRDGLFTELGRTKKGFVDPV